jgi:glycopeptide antibiotics resistance protein
VKNIQRLIAFGLVLYLIVLVRLVVFKYPDVMMEEILRTWSLEGVVRQINHVNIIPFRTILNSLFDPTLPVQLPTLIYNVAAFVPLGVLVPLIAKRAGKLALVLIIAFSLSVALEAIQVFTRLGEGDIDDVILNMLGAAVGYGMFAFARWIAIRGKGGSVGGSIN